jgi:hypothetical protein
MLAVLLPFVWRGMRRHETGPGHHRRTVLAVVGVGWACRCWPLPLRIAR